jgi:hypothetical protein
MTQQQKHAWFNVAVCALTVVSYAILFKVGGPTVATAAFTWFALLGFSQLFYRRSGDAVVIDERDRLIHANSVKVAGAVFWLYFTAACMGPWFAIGAAGAVPVSMLPCALMLGAVLFVFSQSVAMLVQYQRGM